MDLDFSLKFDIIVFRGNCLIMIQVRCLNCFRFLFSEELVDGVIERVCDRCKAVNRIERRGSNDGVRQTFKLENNCEYHSNYPK